MVIFALTFALLCFFVGLTALGWLITQDDD